MFVIQDTLVKTETSPCQTLYAGNMLISGLYNRSEKRTASKNTGKIDRLLLISISVKWSTGK